MSLAVVKVVEGHVGDRDDPPERKRVFHLALPRGQRDRHLDALVLALALVAQDDLEGIDACEAHVVEVEDLREQHHRALARLYGQTVAELAHIQVSQAEGGAHGVRHLLGSQLDPELRVNLLHEGLDDVRRHPEPRDLLAAKRACHLDAPRHHRLRGAVGQH